MENDFKKGLKVDKDFPKAPMYVAEYEDLQKLYKTYVENQENNFENYMYFLRDVLWTLKQYRIVSPFTNFLARIKSEESALNNDSQKAVDDVFGMEIDTGSKGEAEFLCLLLGDSLTKTKEKIKNEETGYKAHHYSGYPSINGLAKRLREIIKTEEYNSKDAYNNFIDSVSEGVKGLWVDKEQARNKKIGIIISDEECLEKILGRIEGYYTDYYEELNTYIKRVKSMLRKTNDINRLNELCDELSKIEKKHYKGRPTRKKNDIYQPIIEIQYKTVDVATKCNDDTGVISHGIYKGDDIRAIQDEYDRFGKIAASRLPKAMYRTNLGTVYEIDEQGNKIPKPKTMKRLNPDQMVEALYPSVITYVPPSRKEKSR